MILIISLINQFIWLISFLFQEIELNAYHNYQEYLCTLLYNFFIYKKIVLKMNKKNLIFERGSSTSPKINLKNK